MALLGGSAQGALKVANYRYWTNGPERMFAGYTYQWFLSFTWAFDATCYASTDPTHPSMCTSADYTPDADDQIVPDLDQTPPGGVQNLAIEWHYPTYKVVNIGTNGNPAGYWNLFQTRTTGAVGQQVTITSTATTTFYLRSGIGTKMQVKRMVGWPAGTGGATTHIIYYDPPGCLARAYPPTVDPVGYYALNPGASNYITCIEISIPTTATPGVYPAGWEVCIDTAGNGCTTFLWSLTIEAPPVLKLSTPAPVAMPAIYDQPTPCQGNLVTGAEQAGTNCSFTHLASGGAEQKGASHWCTDRVNPDTTLEAAGYYIGWSATMTANQVTGLGWYYDAPRVWYHTAAWFNDPLWENCGRAVAARYAEVGPGASAPTYTGFAGFPLNLQAIPDNKALLGPYGNTMGDYQTTHAQATLWALFPRGMEIGLSRFNGGKYSSTWVPNSWNASMRNELRTQASIVSAFDATTTGQPVDAGWLPSMARENGYLLEPIISYRNSGEPLYKMVGTTPTLTPFGWHYFKRADGLASYLLTLSQPGTPTGNNQGRVGNQTWQIVGPLLESAINYYDQTHEPRMGMAIKYVLDIVQSQYDWTNHQMAHGNSPEGSFCGGSYLSNPTYAWYVGGGPALGGGGIGPCMSGYLPEMDGMGAYAFAWAWKLGLGDDSYRQLADEMFKYGLIGSVAGPSYRWNPKAYYQMTKYQWEYLRHRLLAN
jgi:hypothetical protein